MSDGSRARDLDSRVRGDLVDSFDEELEMEIDDDRLDRLIAEFADRPQPQSIDRSFYFKELFRLQGELVKVQDWVVDQKLKLVVIFEGRDAAGKGGAIKRIAQRLNPRVCRVAAYRVPPGHRLRQAHRPQGHMQRVAAQAEGYALEHIRSAGRTLRQRRQYVVMAVMGGSAIGGAKSYAISVHCRSPATLP